MKKLTIFLSLFLGCFWLFGSLDYPEIYRGKRPELLSKFFTSAQLDNSLLKVPKEKELNTFRFDQSAQLNPLWLRIYTGEARDLPDSIQQTDDGGYIVIGTTSTFTQVMRNIFLLKLSPIGGIEWQQSYTGGEWTYARGCQQTSDGGYTITGRVGGVVGSGLSEVFVLKLSPNGDIEWGGAYGGIYGEAGCSIQQTSDGGYIVAGVSTSFAGYTPEGDFDWNVWLLKLSPSGDIEWQRAYGGNDFESDWCWKRQQPTVQQTSDGGYVLATDTESFGAGDADIWVLKLFSNGDIEWQRTYGGESWETLGRGTTIHETEDRGYIIAGNTWSFGSEFSDVWVLKLSSSGDIEWQRTYGGESGGEIPQCIQLTSDGGYIIVGGTTSFGVGDVDFFLLKLSPSGDIEWQRTVGRNGFDDARDVQQTSDEGYVVAGVTSPGTGAWNEYFNFLIVKISSNGEIGADAEFAGISDFTVADTYVLPSDTSIIPADTDGSTFNINFVPEFSGFSSELLSWNLNQPPDNVSFKREVNRSLFRGEAWNTISWEQDPYNSQFVIAEHRVYRKHAEDDEEYQLIGSASGTALEYVDGYLDLADDFVYVVTSVDSDGNESPKSGPVSASNSINKIESSNTTVSGTSTSSSNKRVTRAAKDISPRKDKKIISEPIIVRSKQFSQDRNQTQNLVQPPLNVLLTRGEASQTIHWKHREQNVAEYRIYRKYAGEDDESYRLIGSVPGNVQAYAVYASATDEKLIFAVTAVDVNSNESEKSNPIRN
jgi:hypothetical protein